MKYVIDTREFPLHKVQLLGVDKYGVCTATLNFDTLEELNSDYINEHYGQLHDDAYQRGLEDGKAQSERGCEGCKYERENKTKVPCILCSNNFKNQWTANKIEVGDEVNWLGDCFIVTRIFQPRNMKEQCDGIDDDGCVYHDVLMDDLEKTGRHFDIGKVLEEMKHD